MATRISKLRKEDLPTSFTIPELAKIFGVRTRVIRKWLIWNDSFKGHYSGRMSRNTYIVPRRKVFAFLEEKKKATPGRPWKLN